MPESNAELARRGYEAVLRGDLEVIAGLLDPDVRWHGGDPSAEGSCHSRDQALAVMRRAVDAGGVGELVDVVDGGDRVVVILRPRPPAGQPGRTVANLTSFRDGKVVEMIHYPDVDDALAALRG